MADPWGEFADAPSASPAPAAPPPHADPYAEFSDARPPVQLAMPMVVAPGAIPHDGDTFPLGGRNGRLFGVDAFELGQPGYQRSGPVDLGAQARSVLLSRLQSGATATPTGTQSYGRPVVSLTNPAGDVGKSILDAGMGLATPNYLRGDPARFGQYMEAERLARLNRRGAFAGQFQAPWDYRHHVPDPWAQAQPSTDGKGTAMFWDEPTPFQGLRPEIAKAYLDLARSPTSSPDDLVNFARANGFTINPEDARSFVKKRQAGTPVSDELLYRQAPRVLTDPGDGAFGAGVRGFGDPLNMLDEMGGVVDALGGTGGRENVWNSDRRFGDILYNNIDQNRSILEHDDVYHPWARLGGQFVSGAMIPAGSVEGVGFNAARTALRAGASRFAAEGVAKAAVRNRLIAAGAGFGGVAGFGAGEGGPLDRLPSTLEGAGIGAAGGAALGLAAPYAVRGARAVRQFARDRFGGAVDDVPAGAGVDHWDEFADAGAPAEAAGPGPHASPEVASLGPEGRARVEARGSHASDPFAEFPDVPEGVAPARTAAMASDVETPSISAPVDPYAEFADLMPNIRPMDQRATPEEMAALARSVNPEDVTPIPANAVESMDEAAGIGAGMRPLVDAPDERSVLPPYRLTPGGPVRRDPLDLIGWLRTQGGIREQGGELAHAGIDNAPRQIPFAKSEGFLGSLVRPEGMTFDDAALRAWESGFFPDHVERPTVADFVDALRETHRGGPSRVFHPDDYDALDAYDAAQTQRGRVETAAQEGAPLVEDRGRPVDLRDLEANQPPATAYEDLPSVGGKAGNIRLDGLESPEDIRRAFLSTDAKVGGFDAARRGRVSQGETQALANELGMTPDDLLKRRHGQALNAEQALAARSILARSAQDLVRLARNAQSGTDEAIATFRKAWLRHVAIQEQVSGATAEVGRALAQFKMAAQAGNAPRVLKHLITEGGGRDDIEDVAKRIIDLQDAGGTPGQVNKFAADALKPKFKDKLIELWYNSLLSGPQTHVVNVVSNSLTAALQIPEHMAAAGLGAARNVVARGDVDRVLGSEVGARMVGLLQGTREGLRAFARTARTGDVPDHMTKVEARTERAISGIKGEIIRTPTRLLSAEDELFKGIGRRMEINGLAVRKAASEGVKGPAFAKRVAELSQNPTDEMTEQAMDYARYVTFQRPLNEWGQATSAFTQKVWPLKFIIPFLRTPTNMLKFAVERSPLAPATRHWRADVMAGGARRDLAVAKAALGTGLGLMVTQWAADGHITGNIPADRKEADLLRADGWQPYSIRVGDRYYSYSRLDPMSTTLSAAADIATAARNGQTGDPEKAVNALVASIIDQIDSKTFLSGVASLMHTIDPNGNGGIIDRGSTYAGRQAGSMLVPAIAAQAARTIDPTLRETRGFLPSIESRVPFLSRTLPARADVWGHDIVSQGGLGPDLISPMRMSARRFDPVNTTLLGIGASMGQPSKVLGGVKLSPAQYDAYQRAQGDLIYRSMQGAVANPAFIDLPPLQKLKQFDTLKRDARRSVREGMFGAKR